MGPLVLHCGRQGALAKERRTTLESLLKGSQNAINGLKHHFNMASYFEH